MAEPEKCPDCGERDCGGAPRFKGLSAEERVQLREKEAAERAVCCPEGVRFQNATGQHGNDHPGECDWSELPYDQWPRWESYDGPDGKVAFQKRGNSEDTCLCSPKTGRECLHHMNRRREQKMVGGDLRVPGRMPAMRGVGPTTTITFGPAQEPKGVYVCTECGNSENKEREVICWMCGKGEMVFRNWCEKSTPEARFLCVSKRSAPVMCRFCSGPMPDLKSKKAGCGGPRYDLRCPPDHYSVPVIPTNPEDQKVVDDLVAKSQGKLRTRPLRVGEEAGGMKLPSTEDVTKLVEQATPALQQLTATRNGRDYAGRDDQAEDRSPGESGGRRGEAGRSAVRGAVGGADRGAGTSAEGGGRGVDNLAWLAEELKRAQKDEPKSGQARGWNAALAHLATSLERRRAGLATQEPLPELKLCPKCRMYNFVEGECFGCHYRPTVEPPLEDGRVRTEEYPAVIAALARVRAAGLFPVDVLESAVKGLDPTVDPQCVWCKGTGVAHDSNMVPGETAICPCTTGCLVCRRITSDLKSTEPCVQHGINVRRGESGTLEGEAHQRDVEDWVLDEAEKYELANLHKAESRLPFNPRYLLSMIREIRRSRETIKALVDQKSYMLKEIREISEQRPVAACEGIPLKVRGFEVRVVDYRDRASLVVALDAVGIKVEKDA